MDVKWKNTDFEDEEMVVIATVADRSEDKKIISIIFDQTQLVQGCWGYVVNAKISETGEQVAVKKLENPRCGELGEVNYLKKLKHCNIVALLYHFRYFQSTRLLEYVVMERMPMSLGELYKVPTRLPLLEIKLYMYQLLRSVAYIHHQGICHHNIKPDSVLIDPETCVLKLCDFGFACDLSLREIHVSRKGTLEYMAPELLLGFSNYTKVIDVYSIGCILVELLKGATDLFPRGGDRVRQLGIMMQVFGTPTEDQFPGMEPSYRFEDLPIREAIPWSDIVNPYPISDDAVSLCSGLLCYSPSSRLPAHKALGHKFFDELRSPETKCLGNGNPLPPLFNIQPGEFLSNSTEGRDHPNASSAIVITNESIPSHGCCSIM